MTRQNLYVAVFNAFLGVVFSLLLKGNLLIYVLTFIMVGTIVFIEHKWIYEKVFRKRKWPAIVGYVIFVIVMAGFIVLITRPNRDVSMIVNNVHAYFDHLKPGEYPKSYDMLSDLSRKNYSLSDFIIDHDKARVEIRDFRIDEVTLNDFDKKKALVRISSPFSLYGQTSLSLELVKDDDGWRLVFSPSMVRNKNTASADEENGKSLRKRPREGKVGHFFRSLF